MTNEQETPLIAYKGFDKNFQCRGFQYEIGKEYEHIGKIEVCGSGFHACENPIDVLTYYPIISDGGELNRFAVVEMSGIISKEFKDSDSKIASSKIRIVREITVDKLIEECIDHQYVINMSLSEAKEFSASNDYDQLSTSANYTKLAAGGYYNKLSSAGEYSYLMSRGNNSRSAASGFGSRLFSIGAGSSLVAANHSSMLCSTRDDSKIASASDCSTLVSLGGFSKLCSSGRDSLLVSFGEGSHLLSSGSHSMMKATGKSSISMCSEIHSKASTGENGCIVLTRWDDVEKRLRVSVGYEGENGIKANVMYGLDALGNFVESNP